MAKYLSNIDLNKNQLQNAALHPVATTPATPVEGQVYFDTTVGDKMMYFYDGTGWVAMGSQGDITEIQTTTSAQLTVTNGTGPVPSLAIVTGAVANGGTALATGDQIYDFVTGLGYGTMSSFTVAADGGTNQTITNGNTLSILGTAPISTAASAADTVTITHDNSGVTANTYAYPASVVVNATGHITSITAGSTPGTMSSFTLTGDTGTNQTITNGDTLDVAGGTNISTVVEAPDTVRVNLNDSITLSGTLTANGTGQHTFGGQVTIPSTPTAGTDAASKNYVDTVLAGSGALIYQGGYDADTNTPDLDVSPSASIKAGWTYTVTQPGLFFTEQVRVGDVLIAEVNTPTSLADWTTVQNNIDLATTTTVGIASFSSDNFAVSAAGEVTIKNDGVILGTETTGNYVATISEGSLGIDVSGSGSETAAVSVSLDLNELTETTAPSHLAGNDGSGNTRKFTIANIATEISSANSFAGLIGGLASIPITSGTHGLGADSSAFMVQLVEVSTGATVYADVTRGASGLVTIDFAVAPGANSIRVLIQKIG
jgi:hypothetical protein